MPWDQATEQALPEHEVTHLHLLRHGAVETGGQRRCYGHTDYTLSRDGERQAAALQALCTSELPPPDGVLSSDLSRCRVLAEPLARALGVPLWLEPELREQHMGDWEGRTWADLTTTDVQQVRAFWSDYAHTPPPGGESFAQMAGRVDAFFARRWSELRGRRWLVVGHAGPIRALCARLLGLPVDEALRFAPLPGTHTWFQVAAAGAVVQALGERPLFQDPGSSAETRQGRAARGRPLRVALSGSAGTGKTTLGRALAERWGLPYIPEGMRERIERGLDLHTLGHEGLRALLTELWEEQVAREDAAIAADGGFVADRSPLDFLAFWMLYGYCHDREATDRFSAQVAARLPALDRVIVLPFGALPLQDDGVRTPNPWVQRRFQATVEGLLLQELPPERLARMPPMVDHRARLAWVEDLVTAGGLRPRAGGAAD